jgi:hypothetical protein
MQNPAANFNMQQAMAKIAQLEQQVAQLLSVIKIKPGGRVDITAPAVVSINCSSFSVSAGKIDLDAGMTAASGVVKCDTIIANSVVGSSYTPGAGNIY